MSIELKKLETVLQRYKNNHDFAVKNNNPIRATKYKNLISDIERKIKNIEKDQPLESNTRLRKIIADLKNDKTELREEIKELTKKVEASEQRIESFINPPKPKKPEPKPEIPHECPKCGRTLKNKSALTTHQRYHCKAAH